MLRLLRTLIVAVILTYLGTTLLTPVPAISAQLGSSIDVEAELSDPPTWPSRGAAAIGIEGEGILASSDERIYLASITKVVTVLTILQKQPLALGESGPSFTFTQADYDQYLEYLSRGESRLEAPVGESLSLYQMFEGALLASAGNYTTYLVDHFFSSRDEFLKAAREMLAANNITDISIVEPTGIDPKNTATPAAMIQLAQLAMQNDVVREIVAKPQTELPGIGIVKNTNDLISEPGVIGVKTGTLSGWNLLLVKDIPLAGGVVRGYVAVIDQQNEATRDRVSRELFTYLEQTLQPKEILQTGSVVGQVSTPWGAKANIVTTTDLDLSQWNGEISASESAPASGIPELVFTAEYSSYPYEKDERVGSMTVPGLTGPVTVPLALTARIPEPDIWWRLSNPLLMWGLG